MTLSARSLPRTPGTLTTALPRYPARLGRWLAAWWRGIISRRGRSAALRAQLGFEPRERLLVQCPARRPRWWRGLLRRRLRLRLI